MRSINVKKFVVGALTAVGLTSMAQAAYVANYTISDMPSIVVDTMAKFIVAFQPNITNITDLVVLGLVISLIGAAIIGLVSIAAAAWGKMGGKRKHLG